MLLITAVLPNKTHLIQSMLSAGPNELFEYGDAQPAGGESQHMDHQARLQGPAESVEQEMLRIQLQIRVQVSF